MASAGNDNSADPTPEPVTEQDDSAYVRTVKVGNLAVVKAFGMYGGICHNYPALPFLMGIIVAAVLCAFSPQVSYESSLTELWVAKGSRLQDEMAFHTKHFGGISRTEFILMSDRSSAKTANTEVHMDAFKTLVNDIDRLSEAAVASTNPGNIIGYPAVDNPTQLNMSAPLGIATESNFCASPLVPAVLKPCPACTASGATALAYLQTQNFMAYGYAFVSRCISDNRKAVYGNSLPGFGLPYTWGVDRFPCNRASVLDCFKEGQDSYPRNLQMLETPTGLPKGTLTGAGIPWAPSVADLVFIHSGVNPLIPANYDMKCITGTPSIGVSFETQFTQHLTAAGQTPSVIGPMVAAVIAGLKGQVSQMWAMGYRFRTSYSGLTSAQIASHLSTAVANEKAGFGAAECHRVPGGGFPCCRTGIQALVPAVAIMSSDRDVLSNGTITRFGGFRTVLNNVNADLKTFKAGAAASGWTTSEERQAACDTWEQLMIDLLRAAYERKGSFGTTYQDVRINFFMDRSFADIIKDSNQLEVNLLIGGAVLMVAVSLGLYVPCELQQGAAMVGAILVGFISVAVSILCGYGIMGILDIKLTPVSTVIPLIALGLGLDDMYIILHSHQRVAKEQVSSGKASNFGARYGVSPLATEDNVASLSRVQQFIAQAGPSVLLTTLANFGAFMIASLTPIAAVQTFCWQMAATMLILFTLHFLTLVPLLSFLSSRDMDLPQDAKQPENGKATVTTTFNGLLSNWIHSYFSPFLENAIVKVVVIFISVAFFVVATIWGFTQTEVGLDLVDIVTEGSYQSAFVQGSVFYESYPANIITWGGQDLSSTEVQTALLTIQEELQGSRWVADSSPVRGSSWFANGSISLLAAGGTPNTPLPKAQFYPTFNSWITGPGVIFSPNLVCKNTTDGTQATCGMPEAEIATSSQFFLLVGQDSTTSITDAIRDTRDRVDKVMVGGKKVAFVYGFSYLLWEQYLNIKDLLYKICGYSLLGIGVATLAFQMSPESSMFICGCILKINLECYGALSLLGIKLNAFSVVNLCVSVSLAVEFTAHYSRAFLVASGDGNQRMRAAFLEVGAPMVSGAVSTFLCIVWFAASELKFIRIYYFNFFAAITLIAFWNGTVFLPVMLSIIGPAQLNFNDSAPASEADIKMKEMQEPSKPENAIIGIHSEEVIRGGCCSIDNMPIVSETPVDLESKGYKADERLCKLL